MPSDPPRCTMMMPWHTHDWGVHARGRSDPAARKVTNFFLPGTGNDASPRAQV
jgi:hypothetical protein